MLTLMLFLDCSSDHWKYEKLLLCYCRAYGENSCNYLLNKLKFRVDQRATGISCTYAFFVVILARPDLFGEEKGGIPASKHCKVTHV